MSASANTILVTGASSGMGKATADLFLAAGWRVIGIDISFTPEQLIDKSGLQTLSVDVRSRDELETALARVLNSEDKLSAVANIAGVYPPTSLEKYTEDQYRKIFDINVLGVVNVVAAASPFLKNGASIINFASVDAFQVSPNQLFYGASKAAVVMLTKALSLELAPKGVRVNGLAPGWVKTPGNDATGRMREVLPTIPLERIAEPQEIAEWVMLLANEKFNSFITGETITLSGGAVIRH